MKKIDVIYLSAFLSISLITGCGSSGEKADTKSFTAATAETASESSTENQGALESNNGIFSDEVTIPKEIVSNMDVSITNQNEADQYAKDNNFQKVTYNNDGSITIKMTKKQHSEATERMANAIDEALQKLVDSSDNNITKIDTNSTYSDFKVTLSTDEPSLSDSLNVIVFYIYGGYYNALSGKNVDDVTVDFLNSTGTVIDSYSYNQWMENIDDSSSDNSASSSVSEDTQPLEIGNYGIYANSSYSGGDSVYVDYAALITNPNSQTAAEFPKLTISFENSDGTVLATDYQTGMYVMPGDTVVLSSTLSLPTADINKDTTYTFSVSASDGANPSTLNVPTSADLPISNVSEQVGSYETNVTGKITNNYTSSLSMVRLDALFMKGDDIVGMGETYIDNLSVGSTVPFSISMYDDVPEHDSVSVYAQYWGY